MDNEVTVSDFNKNTLLEQSLRSEYAKRAFEYSTFNMESNRGTITVIKEIFTNNNIPVNDAVVSCFLDDLICVYEKYVHREKPEYHFPSIIFMYENVISALTPKKINKLWGIAMTFEFNFGSLLYPLSPESLYDYYQKHERLPFPATFLNKIPKYLIYKDEQQGFIFYSVPIDFDINQTAAHVKRCYNLLNKNYKQCDDIFKESNSKQFRERENNIKNKLTGLYIYDLLLYNKLIDADKSFKNFDNIYPRPCNTCFCISRPKNVDFDNCDIKGKCRDNFKKQFEATKKQIDKFLVDKDYQILNEQEISILPRVDATYFDDGIEQWNEEMRKLYSARDGDPGNSQD